MRIALLIGLLATTTAPAIAEGAQPQAGEGQEVTVTGRRIQDFRDRLRACLARGCPPNEDVDASLALAEVEFESGEYEDARRTILQSLDRNRRHARQYPDYRERGLLPYPPAQSPQAKKKGREIALPAPFFVRRSVAYEPEPGP